MVLLARVVKLFKSNPTYVHMLLNVAYVVPIIDGCWWVDASLCRYTNESRDDLVCSLWSCCQQSYTQGGCTESRGRNGHYSFHPG
jgi:hypothetical protein